MSAPKNENLNIQFDRFSLWRGKQQILRDVSITFDSTGLTTILGPSGAGKSTLLHVLTRQMSWSRHSNRTNKGTAATGEILLNGVPVNEMDPVMVRRMIGLVLQTPVMFAGTVLDNLVKPQKYVLPDLTAAQRLSEAERCLKLAGLATEIELTKHASTLSGGQQQRLAIARALMMRPNALLLDEPTSALHEAATMLVLDTLNNLKQQIPVILVTHDNRIARLSDRIIVIGPTNEQPESGATTRYDGPSEDLFNQTRNKELVATLAPIDVRLAELEARRVVAQ